MKNLIVSFGAEVMKLRRSRMILLTFAFFIFIPLMMGLLIFIAKNPDASQKLGLIGTKINFMRFGNTDWSAYFDLLSQIVSMIGLMGFGFVASWVFGREYVERTVKDLLALPVPRSTIVLSKYIIVIIWCILLSAAIFASGLLTGWMLGLPGWSDTIVSQYTSKFVTASLLTILLCTPVGLFASIGRGYLPPIGFVVLMLLISQFAGYAGVGPYFPWTIPGLTTVPPGTDGAQLSAVSFIILYLTGAAGFAGTLLWWRFADQT